MYRDAIDLYLRPHPGKVRLLKPRGNHLDRFYVSINIVRRGRPLSPSTIRRIHTVLHSALNTAVKRRPVPHNPADHVKLAPENPTRAQPWTAAGPLMTPLGHQGGDSDTHTPNEATTVAAPGGRRLHGHGVQRPLGAPSRRPLRLAERAVA